MVFIGDRNINPWKNVHNAGVTGYYDLVRGRCMGSTVLSSSMMNHHLSIVTIFRTTCFTLLDIQLDPSTRKSTFTVWASDGSLGHREVEIRNSWKRRLRINLSLSLFVAFFITFESPKSGCTQKTTTRMWPIQSWSGLKMWRAKSASPTRTSTFTLALSNLNSKSLN